MKRYTATFCLVVFGLLCLISSQVQAGPVKLTYSNFFPPAHIQSKLAEAWCKEVEKRTSGRVKVEYYAGQTLTKARQCYDGTVQGLSDLGFSVLAPYLNINLRYFRCFTNVSGLRRSSR